MILLLASTAALATDRVEGADTLAQGSTTVANPYSIGSVNANPAAVGLVERYIFGVGFHYGGRGIHWQATAIDTQTSKAAFGLTYSGDRYNPPLTEAELPGWTVPGQELTNKKRTHDLGFALAAPFLERRLVFGLGGSVSFFDNERSGKGTTGNLNAGVAARPQPWVSLGLSGRNLLPIDDAGSDRPMEIVGSTWLGQVGIASFAFEGGVRPESTSLLLLATGVEVNPTEASAVRAGWRLQDGGHLLSLGAGGGTEEGSVDFAIQAPTNRFGKPLDWTYMLSIRFLAPNIDDVQPD